MPNPGGVARDQVAVLDDRRAGQRHRLRQRHAGRGHAAGALAPGHRRHGHRQVLAVGGVHAAVRGDRDAGGLRDVADAHAGGDPAGPLQVGLEVVDQAPLGGLHERARQVPVLAGGQALPGQPPPHLGEAGHVVRQQVVLDPPQPVRPQRLAEPHGVLDVQRHPAVEHELRVRAEGVARRGHHLFRAADALGAVLRPVRVGQLEAAEAQIPVPLQVEAGGVAGDPFLLRAAEQGVHRHAQALALGVPQRQVHGADRVRGQAASAIGGADADHHVVQLLRGRHRLADQVVAEVVVDDRGDRPGEPAEAQAGGAVVERYQARALLPARTGLGAAPR